jgi:prevent-host-death family protein
MEVYMAQQIGAFEAKTHFSRILEKAEQGADFIVTKRGKPVAKIIPFKQDGEMTWEKALDEFRKFRKCYRGNPGSFNIRKAIEEGRP